MGWPMTLALRCGGKVFDAERIAMDFGHYHKKCFSCAECTRVRFLKSFSNHIPVTFLKPIYFQMLDAGTATETPDRRLVCRACYAKLHGPQVQNFTSHTPEVFGDL